MQWKLYVFAECMFHVCCLSICILAELMLLVHAAWPNSDSVSGWDNIYKLCIISNWFLMKVSITHLPILGNLQLELSCNCCYNYFVLIRSLRGTSNTSSYSNTHLSFNEWRSKVDKKSLQLMIIVKKCSNNEENEIEGRKCFHKLLLPHPSEICFIHNGRVQSEFTINQSFLHLSAIANDKRERHWYSLQVYSVTIWIIQQGGSPPLVQNRKSRPSRPFRSSKHMIYSVCSRSPLNKVAMHSRLSLHLV